MKKHKDMYLDHASTTSLDGRVMDAMKPYLTDFYGNAGSIHSKGLEAERGLVESKKTIAKILNCRPEEIIFTGSGTESINLAIKGVAHELGIRKKKGRHLITQKTEHHAVLHTCAYLEKQGFEVTYLDVNREGLIDVKQLEESIREDTILVSIMYANNEIGVIQPLKEISNICKKRGVFFHTDACQAGCFLDLDVKDLGVDFMTLNSSKVYGPKGVGLLYKKLDVNITPLHHGGGQEWGLRAGTENVAGIVGFAKALDIAQNMKKEESKRLEVLSKKLREGILKSVSKVFVNGSLDKRLCNNVNITFLDVEGEALVLALDKQGIQVSTGSACTSKSVEPSHVIKALGVKDAEQHANIRFSLGRETSEEDIEYVLSVLPGIVKTLRELSPMNTDIKEFEEVLSEENKALSFS